MSTSKQIVDLIYSMVTENNLSRALPVLDEHIALYISENVPFGGVYHGRSGFLTMISKLYSVWDQLQLSSLTYFIPEMGLQESTVVITGRIEGYPLKSNELTALPFLHHWTLADEKITELRAFHWDVDPLLHQLQFGTC